MTFSITICCVSPARHGGFSHRSASTQLLVLLTAALQCLMTAGIGSAPVFTRVTFNTTLKEDVAVGTFVLRIEATDADGDPLDYSIHETNNYFSISAISGEVKTAKKLDRETIELHSFKTSVTDYLYSTDASVLVRVEDVNDNAPVCHPSVIQVHVSEAENVGKHLTQVNCTDRDAGLNKQLLFEASSDGSVVGVHNESGVVFLHKNVDYEERQIEEENVTVRDYGVPSLSANVTLVIIVDPINEYSPVFENKTYDALVKLPTTPNTTLLTVSAHDLDEGADGQIVYKLTTQNKYYTIDQSSGELRSRSTVWNYCSHDTIFVKAMDLGYQPKSTTVKVRIAFEYTPTCASQLVQVFVQESVSLGTTVYSLNCSDPYGHLMMYAIVGGNGHFQINDLGNVIVARSLDYEIDGEYRLTVSAKQRCPKSSNATTATVTLLVTLIGVNEFSPLFTQSLYNISVWENASFAQAIGKVRAYDGDKGRDGEVSYLIIKAETPFFVDARAGNLILAGQLDREKVDSYEIKIKAIDNGVPEPKSSTATVFITVNDVNDNSPACFPSLYAVNVVSPISVGEKVVDLSCKDADSNLNAKLTYHISNQPYRNLFAISDNGSMHANRTVAGKSHPETVVVTVTVSDSGLPRLATNVSVVIQIGASSKGPYFDPPTYNVSVTENSPIGFSVLQINARGGSTAISYHIVAGNDDGNFAIGQNSGSLYVAGILDREKRDSYQLAIKADNGISNITIVFLDVGDVNDNRPTCSKAVYSVEIAEDAPVTDPQVLLRLTCSDVDLGENGRLVYKIQGQTQLTVDNYGVIRGIVTQSMKAVTILVEDNGVPQLSTAVVAVILIKRSNQQLKLSFEKSIFHLQIPENVEVNTTVFAFRCTAVNNGEIIAYEIVSSDNNQSNSHFFLDEKGRLSLRLPLQYKVLKRHGLIIRCRSSVASSFAYVNIDVLEVTRTCNPTHYGGIIMSQNSPGHVIAQLNCVKTDVSFIFKDVDWKRYFAVNASGHFIVRSLPKTQQRDRVFVIGITAVDRRQLHQNTTITVFIYIVDSSQSENTPFRKNDEWHNHTILLDVQAENLDQWIQGDYREIRTLLALSATLYCSSNMCRQNDTVFRDNDVVVVQQQARINSGRKELTVALYMTFPSTNVYVPLKTLVDIALYARENLSRATRAVIGEIQPGRLVSSTTSEQKGVFVLAAAGGALSVFLLVGLVIAIVLCTRKRRKTTKVAPFGSDSEDRHCRADPPKGTPIAQPDHDASVRNVGGVSSSVVDMPGAVNVECVGVERVYRKTSLRRHQTQILSNINKLFTVTPTQNAHSADLLQSDDSGIDVDVRKDANQ